MKDAPASVRTFAVLGSEFHLPSVKVPKHKPTPFLTEARRAAEADALGPNKRDRIRDEAREAAARIMAEWDGPP